MSERSAQPSRRTSYLVFHSGFDESQKQRVEEEEEEEEEEEGGDICSSSCFVTQVKGAR